MPISTRQKLKASVAVSALTLAVSSGAAHAQATVDLDFGGLAGPVYVAPVVSADVGSILAQQSTGLVSATNQSSGVTLQLLSNTGSTITHSGTYNEVGNLFSGAATANITDSSVIYNFTPSTSGDTAVAGSYQTRIDPAQDVTALNSGNTHSVDIRNDSGSEAVLTGTLLVDSNDITSSAVANSANSAITLSSGVNVLEDTNAQASVVADSTVPDPAALDSDNAADILVASGQVTSGASILASTNDGDIEVVVEEVDGATITVSNSDITASATGNTAAGAISSSDTTATITASTAVSNMQLLDIAAADAVRAQVADSDITLAVGREGIAGSNEGTVDDSTLRIMGNRLASTAEGNDSNQSISLVANALTGGGTADSSDSAAGTAGVQLSASADAVVTNTQIATGGTNVEADTSDSDILLVFDLTSDADRNTLGVTGNTISATARGADTANSLTLQAGATMSATGAVANVQVDGGMDVTADVESSSITVLSDDTATDDFDDGTISNSSNSIVASATGARANNDLTVAVGTNTLSLADNSGSVVVPADLGTGGVEAPTASAGFVITNDQEKDGGTVVATVFDSSDIEVFIDDSNSYDMNRSTVNVNSNTLSSQAVGSTADNLITLNFNNLAGTLASTGDSVAIAANNQTISNGAVITARTEDDGDGDIVRFLLEDNAGDSTVTVSSNRVSAVAVGNQTTNNDIVVNATDIEIASGVDALPNTNFNTAVGDLTGTAAFYAGSVQEFDGGTLLATQNNSADTVSNTIRIAVGAANGSTLDADSNVLSVLAVGNEAANSVALGTATTSTVKASSASANVQLIRAGDIDGVIGVVGTDPVATYSSAKASNTPTGTFNSLGGSQYQNTGVAAFTITFATPLNATEQAILTSAGFTNVTATQADVAAGATISAGGLLGIAFTDPGGVLNSGDETFGISTFNRTGTAPTLNDAGVIIDKVSDFSNSSLSVTNNTIAGEVRGNVATNTTSVTGTTVTATSTSTATTDVNANVIAPTNASTVVTNLQSVGPDGTPVPSDIDMSVAGTFAIQDVAGDPRSITGSQQNVDDNLLQSYATANRVTNGITVTATNSSADAVIENDQRSAVAVSTDSDLDLMAAFGMSTSTTSIDGNSNQSVANANIESSSITVDATNVSAAAGAPTSASVNRGTDVVTGDAIVGSEQVYEDSVTADATTDAFNEEWDLTGASVDNIDGSTASISSNVTIAQATGNTSSLSGEFGTASTANYDASGALAGQQSGSGSVSADTDVQVGLNLNDDEQTVLSSTVNLDANQASATARGNVITTDLSVAGTNIEGGNANADATLNGGSADNTAAFVVATDQGVTGTVTSDSSGMSVLLDLTSTSVTDTDATLKTSTATLSSNRSTSTATGNTGDNTLALGLVGSTSSLTATGGLLSDQTVAAPVSATGGMSVVADVDTFGASPAAVVNAVSGSQLSLASNVSSATATGNSADNSVTAVSTQITAGSANDADANAATPLADAGFTLLNLQTANVSVSSTNTANTVSAELTAEDQAVASSTVSLSDNGVTAVTFGNDAENVMTLGSAGTTSTLSSTGALVSSQVVSATTSATAGVTVTADIDSTDADATAMGNSTLSVSGNSSLASATNNNVLNSLNAMGTNMTAGAADTDATITGTDADAAYALGNYQRASGSLTATNTANTFSIDVDSADEGVGTSTISLSSNQVEARATSNLAVNNSMGLGGSGTAAISATGAINNNQDNDAVVNANADSSVRVTIDTSDTLVNAVSGSTVRVENNATTAMARGNVALNAMAVSSAAATGGDANGAGLSGGVLNATYGILNTQDNSAQITGTVAGTIYGLTLNGGAPSAELSATGSTFAMAGNVVDAIAYGNVATNTLTLASLNGVADDASAMVANAQVNSGAISASLGSSAARFIADGAVPTSTVGVTGNAFRSTAVGNYATSVVSRN